MDKSSSRYRMVDVRIDARVDQRWATLYPESMGMGDARLNEGSHKTFGSAARSPQVFQVNLSLACGIESASDGSIRWLIKTPILDRSYDTDENMT